jgi:hypothetical protein
VAFAICIDVRPINPARIGHHPIDDDGVGPGLRLGDELRRPLVPVEGEGDDQPADRRSGTRHGINEDGSMRDRRQVGDRPSSWSCPANGVSPTPKIDIPGKSVFERPATLRM